MAVWKGKWSIGWLTSCTERVCIMNIRLVCVLASSSCIGIEPAAYVTVNVESRKCDFRAVRIHWLLRSTKGWSMKNVFVADFAPVFSAELLFRCSEFITLPVGFSPLLSAA